MGISYSGGKLPYMADLLDAQFCEEIEDLYCEHEEEYRKKHKNTKGFFKKDYEYKNGWTLNHDGVVFDDISTRSTFKKKNRVVYLGALGDGEDYFLVSNKKADVQAFLNDFGIDAEIEKNAKVVQVS